MKVVIIVLVAVAVVAAGAYFVLGGKDKPVNGGGAVGKGEVVLYVAHDQDYAEDIIAKFTAETGIKVIPKFDSEADKTIGLANRIMEENKANNPQCDLYWNNEPMHTIRLAKAGCFQPYSSPGAAMIPAAFKDKDHLWTGFAARARVIGYNTNTPDAKNVKGLADFADPKFKGKLRMAMPLAGSTLTHMTVLYSIWGKDKFASWLKAVKDNDVVFAGGNGGSAEAVVAGQFYACATDTDDVISMKEEGKSIDLIFPDASGDGTLVFPNTLAIIKGCKNLENAKYFYDWLMTDKLELELCMSPSAQIPLHSNIKAPVGRYSISDIKAISVDWYKASSLYDDCQEILKQSVGAPK